MNPPPAVEPIVLAWSDAGGAAAPVLFVHGFSHTGCVWAEVAGQLGNGFRAIAVDLRGHGASEWSPEGHYHPADYAADLPATLDALGIEEVNVVAHSLGGNAALLFAAAAPERVRALVLVDTGPELSRGGGLHVVGEVAEALRSYASVAAYRERLAQMHPSADAELLDRMAHRGVVRRRDGRYEPALDPGVLGGAGTAAAVEDLEATLWGALARVRCPTLVVRGGLSAVLNEDVARRMTDEVLGDGRLATCPAAGHGVMLDDAPGLAAHVSGFLAEA